MAKSITTSSRRVHFNFTNVKLSFYIFGHPYSDVLSKQSRTTEEGITSSLGNTEATATQGIGDTIITGCWTCMVETNQKDFLDPQVIFFLCIFLLYSFPIIQLKIERDGVTSRNSKA